MSETTVPVDASEGEATHPAACENCGITLQGHYCHACGQSSHNPLHSLGHAIEEVFESFWHLDGRVFRTLRELFVPGQVARNYLAGHRVRYIPPLRLFVILSLVTFFIGKLAVHGGGDQEFRVNDLEFGQMQTIAQVEQARDRLLADIDKAEAEAPAVAKLAIVGSRASVRSAAAGRIAQLRAQGKETAAAGAQTSRAAGTAETAGPAAKADAPVSPDVAAGTATPDDADKGSILKLGGKRWDPATNPVKVDWLPGFANRWINSRLGKAEQNLEHIRQNEGELQTRILGAVPTALFVLMPFFALLLKLVHLGSGRGYLEHLVVALYSHVFLLLMLALLFVFGALEDAGMPKWLTGIASAAVWLWTPIYLWLMQRRIYGGGWLPNLLRYVVTGSIYFVLVVLVILYASLMGISS